MQVEDARPIGAARVVLAASLGLIAALIRADASPIDADRDVTAIGRIDLLAPRGRLDAAPFVVRWSTTRDAARFRVRAIDELGELLFERLTDEGRARSVRLAAPERRAWEAGRVVRLEVDLTTAEGELAAASDRVATWIAVGEPPIDRAGGRH